MLENKFIVLVDKKGQQWKVPYSECRHATGFVRCFLSSNIFHGTWTRGVTIYVPRELLKGFPRGLQDTGSNAPEEMAFHLPAQRKDIPEIVSFLEKRNCVSVSSPTSSELLTFIIAPTLFLWVHFAFAILLIDQIEIYGLICSMVIGIISGWIFATSFIAVPYQKKRYVFQKRVVFYSISALNAISVGFPFFVWNMLQDIPELQPSISSAVFIIVLCFIESFLWYYCLLIKRKPYNDMP